MGVKKFYRPILGYDGEMIDGGGGSAAVESVNGQTGAVVLTAADVDAVSSVNGVAPDEDGNVMLGASDVDAKPASYQPTWAQVTGKSVVNADVSATAAIATTKLAASADIAALAAARATPAANSVDPVDIAAVLVALGVMAAV